MKLLLDLQLLQSDLIYHGIGKFTYEIAKGLLHLNPEHTSILLHHNFTPQTQKLLQSDLPLPKIHLFHSPGFTNYPQIYSSFPKNYQEIWSLYELLLEYRLTELTPDLYISFYLYSLDNLTSLAKLPKPFPTILFFYDLIPFLFPEHYLDNPFAKAFYEYKFKETPKADFYFAISHCTKKDLQDLAKVPEDSVEVVYPGCAEHFRELEITEKLRFSHHFQTKYGITHFILYNPSSGDWRKNLKPLIRAFSNLPPELLSKYHLVITSKIPEYRLTELKAYVHSLGLDHKVLFTGYVPDDELCALYNLCDLFVYPSLYEGFGLPLLEAMNCGAPVLASNSSSIPEILPHKEALFDPQNPSQITEKITQALTDRNFRAHLRELSRKERKRFSYKQAIQKVNDTLKQLLTKKKTPPSPPKEKKSLLLILQDLGNLSWLSPQKLINYLSNHYDLTLLSPHAPSTPHPHLTTKDLLSSPKPFDRILYLLKSPPSPELTKLLTLYPGLLILDTHKALPELPLLNLSVGALFLSETQTSLKTHFPLISESRVKFLSPPSSPEEEEASYQRLLAHIEEVYPLRLPTSSLLTKLSPFVSHPSLPTLLSLNTAPLLSPGRLLIDVSFIARFDAGTGIQRVVKAQLRELLNDPPQGYIPYPVFYSEEEKAYFYAHTFLSRFLNKPLPTPTKSQEKLYFQEGDILYCPDLNYLGVIDAYHSQVFSLAKSLGVKLAFLVYDLLPLRFPHYFDPHIPLLHEGWLKVVLTVGDLIFCISNAVAEEVLSFAEEKAISLDPKKVLPLPIGVDLPKDTSIVDLTEVEFEFLSQLADTPYFLMVSTLEPRKGHFLILKAFELLWQEGYNLRLLFVGKRGWLVDELIDYISKHPEQGRRFFWLGYVSDALLFELYRHALATIVASEGEGFGLPLIEAASLGCPVIARDIPVFREVGGSGAFYFPDTKDPSVVASYLKTWLELHSQGKAPSPSQIKWLTWKENCTLLKTHLLNLLP